MTIEERQALAAKMHAAGGNCAQAVAYALSDLVSDKIDQTALYSAMEAFGLGMGGMEGTCGALSGAVAVAGLKNSSGTTENPTKGASYKLSREIVGRFQAQNHAVRCKDLKGVETGKVLRSCPDCINDAVRIACEVLGAAD